ncbi:MAG: hypothetical protein KDD63_19425 [Bacteroidetes bacterium]|nr:hypothetical protein [Bacteroidota bacterium]MCB0844698.1 hypothetical protein [Bacteroidota bacterium]MCB0854406.1 hypothetical protein [Bacteroidota bacterium]
MNKHILLFFFLMLSLSGVFGQQPNVVDEKVTSAGNIATTINNLGMIGNSFSGSFNVEGFPSCEYPVNSGIEHIFDGGLWVGGIIGGELAVSSGAIDDASGYSTGKRGFEFTSVTPLRERSTLFDNPFFTPEAVSHQDFVSTFTDSSIFINTGGGKIQITDHLRPLNVEVDFQAYNWNFTFANFFVIVNYRIKNVGNQPIDSVFLGYWVDGVIRNVNITPPGGSAFFSQGGNGYIDSLNMGYEFDALGDVGYTDSYVAVKYLGSEYNGFCPSSPNFKVHFNTWQFRNSADPLYFFPTSDLQKYDKMANGLNYLPSWPDIQKQINGASNRSNFVSVGPYTRLRPGEYIDIAFAVVCAKRVFDGLPASANTAEQRRNLIQNAQWAQTAYDGEDANGNCILDPGEDRDGDGKITRFILPTPPDRPKMKIVSSDNQIDVYWSDNSEASVDPISQKMDFEGYRLYKTAVGFDVQNTQDIIQSLNLVGEWDLPGDEKFLETGFEAIRLDDPVTFEDDPTPYYYQYTFENIADGWQHVIALTAFDEGDEVNNLESLESAVLANMKQVFAGKPANDGFANGDPFVYPNPYYSRADWEGASSFEEDRKIIFANLPRQSEIRIYTLAGDLVDVFEHNEAYNGSDTRWHETYSDPENTVFSGGEHAWDLLSRDNQIIARGLYLFVVRDLISGDLKRGKFVIIK